MKYWQWVRGRQQNCEYWKFCLWSFKIFKWGFDAYILDYSPYTLLDWHRDPVENGEHYRLNIELTGKSRFLWRKPKTTFAIVEERRFIFFRPDIYEHKVYIEKGGCKKLSLGFVKFK